MQSTIPFRTDPVLSSDDDDCEALAASILAKVSGFDFYNTIAYPALVDHGIAFEKLPQFLSLTDAYHSGHISAEAYFTLLSETVQKAVADAAWKQKPTVPDAGNA